MLELQIQFRDSASERESEQMVSGDSFFYCKKMCAITLIERCVFANNSKMSMYVVGEYNGRVKDNKFTSFQFYNSIFMCAQINGQVHCQYMSTRYRLL